MLDSIREPIAPDIVFFGHTKNIELNTFDTFKSINKNLILSQWNEDPVMQSLNYSKQNITNIKMYSDFVDHNFITTDPSVISNKLTPGINIIEEKSFIF